MEKKGKMMRIGKDGAISIFHTDKEKKERVHFDSIIVEMQGDKDCWTGDIIINGIKLGHGVKNVELELNAMNEPVVIVEYLPSAIPEELLDIFESDCP